MQERLNTRGGRKVPVVDRAMHLQFASIVATPSATLPVAGTVHNTDTLLGQGGPVGVATVPAERPMSRFAATS